ncbi:MAG: GNAT family N-acetyltransferase [Muribaculaceae bacterium]|nr:GNAT family N-acetyltransferase [Muribaculaceae bacterium]
MIDLRINRTLPTLIKWRAEVLQNVFGIQPSARLLVANRQYYRQHVADGSHVALIASIDGEDCGCGGICLSDELPSPDNPTGRCGFLMNIYVRQQFRNHGVAHAIVSALLDVAKQQGCGKIFLETTNLGRSVYSSLGFKDMKDMMKYYDTND